MKKFLIILASLAMLVGCEKPEVARKEETPKQIIFTFDLPEADFSEALSYKNKGKSSSYIKIVTKTYSEDAEFIKEYTCTDFRLKMYHEYTLDKNAKWAVLEVHYKCGNDTGIAYDYEIYRTDLKDKTNIYLDKGTFFTFEDPFYRLRRL